MNKLNNNIGWFFLSALVLVLSSACGQSATASAKSPIYGETVIDVSSPEERAAAIRAAAYDRPAIGNQMTIIDFGEARHRKSQYNTDLTLSLGTGAVRKVAHSAE